MRRSALMLAVLAAFILPATASGAPYPTPTNLSVSISPSMDMSLTSVGGTTDASQLVEVWALTPGGMVKGYGRRLATPAGSFNLQFTDQLDPGDRVVVMLGGNPAWTYSMVYSQVLFSGVDAAAGTISGVVTPRKPRVIAAMQGERVVADAVNVAKIVVVSWRTSLAGRATSPAGGFVVKPTLTGPGWTGSYRRNDFMIVGYQTYPVPGNQAFVFTAQFLALVPGLYQTQIGSSVHMVVGFPGRAYSATLLAPDGSTKAVARLKGTSYFLLQGVFTKPDGTPVRINSGDTIRLAGPGGFSTPVPLLRAAIGAASDTVRIFGPPNSRIEVRYSLFDDNGTPLSTPPPQWVKMDSTGTATVHPEGYDLRFGDRVRLFFKDATGNNWYREVQSLAPAP